MPPLGLDIRHDMVDLTSIRAAAKRIEGLVRRTPMIAAPPVKTPPGYAGPLVLKLELLQVTGSFKPRGAINTLRSLAPEDMARGIVTASGGNHGLGVAYAGHVGRVPATIFLPTSAPKSKIEKLRQWGADVRVEGAVWDDANRAALAFAQAGGLAYIHPFADARVIAGQGTLGLEILADDPAIDTLIVAIGGGGLIAGIALAAKALKPAIRVIGVEPTGAPTLYESVCAGKLVELPEITTEVGTLAPRRSAAINLDIVSRSVDAIVLVSDDEMRHAARWLWFELGLAVELSAAAALASLAAGRYRPRDGERVCALICGAGSDGVG